MGAAEVHCPLLVRSVEEHVEGFGQRRSLPGGGAGQLNRRDLDRAPREIKHAAPHLGPGVHGSVQGPSLIRQLCVSDKFGTRRIRLETSASRRIHSGFDT